MQTPKKRFIFIGIGVVVLLLLAAVFGVLFSEKKKTGSEQTNPAEHETVYVRVVEVKEADEFQTYSFPGMASESQTANLSFRVPGLIVELNAVTGQKMAKDEIIAKLDSRDYELLVKRIESEIDAANAVLSASVSQAELAETNLKRFEKLLKEEAATQAQFDTVKTHYDTAIAAREAAETRINGLNVSLAEAKHKLDDSVLRAPHDGSIVEKFVKENEVVAAGIPIVAFADSRQIDVSASLPEDVMVRSGGIAGYSCEFEAYPNKMFAAKLKEMGHAVQRGKQTYPLTIRVDIPPENETPLFSGMTATVHLKIKRPQKPLIVPTAALLSYDNVAKENDNNDKKNKNDNKAKIGKENHNKENAIVWIIDPQTQTIQKREVKVLRLLNNGAEIEADIKTGEKIIAAGARFLSEGQKVQVAE